MNVQNLLREVSRESRNEQAFRILDNIEYRRVRSEEDLIDIIKIRRDAYESAQIYADSDAKFVDDFDLDPRVYVFGVYWHERPVATMRIHIVDSSNPTSNSRHYFPNVIDPLLEQGLTFMDPTRFAVEPGLNEQIPGLASIVLRLGLAAVRHFNCDFGLAMIKEGHGGFYRKLFNYTQMTPLQQFSAFKPKYALYSTSRSHTETVCENFPVLDGLPIEAKMLFSEVSASTPAVLSVKPTARIAFRNRLMRPVFLEAAQ